MTDGAFTALFVFAATCIIGIVAWAVRADRKQSLADQGSAQIVAALGDVEHRVQDHQRHIDNLVVRISIVETTANSQAETLGRIESKLDRLIEARQP